MNNTMLQNSKEFQMKNWNKIKGKVDRYGKMVVFGILLAGAVACEKPDPAPEPTPTPTPTPTTQKHNVELVYGKVPSTQWQHIELDTIQKYSNDKDVDTIFMVPETYNQFSALTTEQLQTRVIKLRERKNVNPEKVFGKGELMLKSESVRDNPEIIAFFADTLKYNVTYNYQKSR